VLTWPSCLTIRVFGESRLQTKGSEHMPSESGARGDELYLLGPKTLIRNYSTKLSA
jgi:hypothetical protein